MGSRLRFTVFIDSSCSSWGFRGLGGISFDRGDLPRLVVPGMRDTWRERGKGRMIHDIARDLFQTVEVSVQVYQRYFTTSLAIRYGWGDCLEGRRSCYGRWEGGKK